MKKTAYFGGSFNPPHTGHLGVAAGALSSGRTDEVWLAPAYRPPHKPGKPLEEFCHRAEMIRLLIAGKSGMELCDIEDRLRLEPSYTILILEHLERENPDRQIQLLIGGDSLRQFHTWYCAAELAERFEILTYPRDGETPELEDLRRNWPAEMAEKLYNGILSGDFFKISSTNIRNVMEKPADMVHINKGSIPDAVWEYIQQQRLYRRKEDE